jgi:hypothetical protein
LTHSVATPGSSDAAPYGKRNSAGMTPTTVTASPSEIESRRRRRPRARRAWRAEASLTPTTAAGSSGSNVRPRSGTRAGTVKNCARCLHGHHALRAVGPAVEPGCHFNSAPA